MTENQNLLEKCRAAGIHTELDFGIHKRPVSEDSLRTILSYCEPQEPESGSSSFPETVVGRRTENGLSLNVEARGGLEWEITTESGEILSGKSGVGDGLVNLPVLLDYGYHQLRITPEGGDQSDTLLVLAPDTCYVPPHLEERRVWGLATQLYSLSSDRNFGIGDFQDLHDLMALIDGVGGAFIGLNPLHALPYKNPLHVSPYSPSSRLAMNFLYLDVTAIPDFAECEAARNLLSQSTAALEKLRASTMVDYQGASELKKSVLRLLFESFREKHLQHGTERAREFSELSVERPAVAEYALFEAIDSLENPGDPGKWGWLNWSNQFKSGPTAEAYQRHESEMLYFLYLQWQLRLQLRGLGLHALANHSPLGLYLDLAVGAEKSGAEVWANQDLFALKAGVGAPPDEYSAQGQNWGLPPMIPSRLRQSRFQVIRNLYATNMRQAGAIRIDHVLSILRLFWIPEGGSAADGTYVEYPTEEISAIIRLESHKNQCLVIGEDLGVVPPELTATMRKNRMFSYSLAMFSKDDSDNFVPSESFPEEALLSFATHDLPTIVGYWQGKDLQLKKDAGTMTDEQYNSAIEGRHYDKMALLRCLGLNEGDVQDEGALARIRAAIFAHLAAAPSRILAITIEDILGLETQINLPGVVDGYPSWKQKVPTSVGRIGEVPAFREALEVFREKGR